MATKSSSSKIDKENVYSYKELQSIAKEYGIRANLSAEDLKRDIKLYENGKIKKKYP